jgi:hypothetical protein
VSAAYLARWSGPVNESDDPYHPTDANTSPPGLPPQKHVQDLIMIAAHTSPGDSTHIANIKTALMTYGAVDASIYWADSTYNAANSAYYYSGTVTAATLNHDITVVGWDDNYSASNFSHPPANNGAFLIKNSWGTSFGLSGYFWISYYDTGFGVDVSSVFAGNQPVSNYTTRYDYDPLGWVNNLGYPHSTTAWFANVFTATASEQLQAVATYVASNNSSYVIYIYTDVTVGPTTGTLRGTSSGTFSLAGYHTVALNTPVSLTSGRKFSVVMQLTTPGFNYPVPVEYAVTGYSSHATASPGQSYISADGISWEDTTASVITDIDTSTMNVALKAFSGGPQVSTVAVNPTAVIGGNSAIATVTLAAAAPAGGGMVLLSSSDTAVQVPLSVTVPAGATSATFTATTSAVDAQVFAIIGAGAAQTTLTVNPQPWITSLSTPTIKAGSAAFTLAITGHGFANGAGVSWNGSDRTSSTTWISSSSLTLPVSAADIASAGTVGITVTNPASAGGATSSSFDFVIDTPGNEPGAFTITTTPNPVVLTVTHGQSTTLQVSLNGANSGAQISVSCLNLPTGASCSYSNGVVTISTSATTPLGTYYNIIVTFTVTQMAALARHRVLLATWLGALSLPLGLLWLEGRRRKHLLRWLILVLAIALFLFLGSCGGGHTASLVTTQSSVSATLTVN